VFFYPTPETVEEVVHGLGKTETARLFLTPIASATGGSIVRHHLTATVLVDLTHGPDAIWAGMKAGSRTRSEIRTAEKHASRITLAQNGPRAERDFLMVFNDFARASGAVRSLSKATLDRYRAVGDVFVIYLDEKPMCVSLALRDEQIGRARLLYSANYRLAGHEEAKLCSALGRYMLWLEFQRYMDKGFSTYDLGGIKIGAADGISGFKRSFGGTTVVEHSYFCAGTRWLGSLAYRLYECLSERAHDLTPADDQQNLPDAISADALETGPASSSSYDRSGRDLHAAG
ncbi:MAG: hypothetical protein ACREQC_06430, partial [Candidatus Binataceae bacterium]